MRRAASFVLLLTCAYVVSACASGVRPSPHEIQTQRVLPVSFDTAWRAAVSYASLSRVPIATLEKDSGLIVFQQHTYDRSEVDEGEMGFLETVTARQANGNLTLVAADGGTSVRVNLTHTMQVQFGNGSGTFPYRYTWFPSYSIGLIEKRVLDGIQAETQHTGP